MISVVQVIREWLLLQPLIIPQVGTRIWGMPGIPSGEVPNMPQKAITVYQNLGTGRWGVPLYNASLQFRCYGATSWEAEEVWGALYDTLHRVNCINVTIGADDYTIYVSQLGSGPSEQQEPITKWPYQLCNFVFVACESAMP